MKIIRAEFKNFRLLRDLKIEFSTDSDRKLTVIRAENETGKTTILNALQWALYGDDALPGKREDYRLHPIDWNTNGSGRISISAQVEFETTSIIRRKQQADYIETARRYRIVRSAFETLNGAGAPQRSPSTVKLYHVTMTGSDPIDHPRLTIDEELPQELRNVFFTDGDRALRFIETSTTGEQRKERQKRVEKAIQSLLGLDVIENAQSHIKKTMTSINNEIKKTSSDKELTEVTDRLDQIDKDLPKLKKEIDDAEEQSIEFLDKIKDLQREINNALIKGDRKKLSQDIEQTEEQIKFIDSQITTTTKDHSALFKSLALSRDLLSPVLKKSLAMLSKLRDQGKIPSTTIPVLEDRLSKSTCICGESLDSKNTHGLQRREHIERLIDDSRKADALQSQITDLYFGSRPLQPDHIGENDNWLSEYSKISERRYELESRRNEQGKKLKDLEKQLADVPETDVQSLLDTKQKYECQRDRFIENRARFETQYEGLEKERTELNRRRSDLLRERERNERIKAELQVAEDIEQVLKSSYERITTEELRKVSHLMNDIFLKMIGADPEQGAIINEAIINQDFDIVVYGTNKRTLNPDRDLNGASRRALTLAFILALARVSEAQAPNVIDTPLGMMSGYVKKSVLRTLIRESSQLVLFLTRSEIADCEDILDDEAGHVTTLTNSAHFPTMLVNDPQVNEITVLACKCNHRQECEQCQRRIDTESSTTGEVS